MDKEMRKMIAKRAAKYFKSGDTVNLGIGIPSLCCDYAEPGVMFQSENGFVGVGEIARRDCTMQAACLMSLCWAARL
jgi:acyl CoA:acetate/3-ketoacid CoA transferase beta subunit